MFNEALNAFPLVTGTVTQRHFVDMSLRHCLTASKLSVISRDSSMEDKDLVIYDGVCNFCNGAVAFILKRDKTERFIFSPMQSEYVQPPPNAVHTSSSRIQCHGEKDRNLQFKDANSTHLSGTSLQ